MLLLALSPWPLCLSVVCVRVSRSLWLVLLQGRHQGRDFVWSTYSALRHHLNHIAA